MPHAGDEFRFQNLHVTVTKADQRKVIEIKVQILPEEESDEDEDK
jgi:Mg2+/Co2+ transporter CorC